MQQKAAQQFTYTPKNQVIVRPKSGKRYFVGLEQWE